MSSWSLSSTSKKDGRTYVRPLGPTEVGFFWDSLFSGTADSTTHTIVETSGSNDKELLGERNVSKTWIWLKKRFPLLGARVGWQQKEMNGTPQFVVSESQLNTVSPGEIILYAIGSAKGADALGERIVNGPRQLSNDRVARLYILHRLDQTNLYHVFIHAAHYVTDGVAHYNLLRAFLDSLFVPDQRSEPDLEARLSMAIAEEDLNTARKFSLARQRWRRAIAHTIFLIKQAKLEGGHTLPRKLTPLIPYQPAHSARMYHTFSNDVSSRLVDSCRRRKLTISSVYPVLAQVALARMLIRRYRQGEISQDEWEHRIREPMHIGGPLNLRPFLDKEWFDKGGSREWCLCISFYFYTIPLLPRGDSGSIVFVNGAPSFADLLSDGRFFLRCNMLKAQSINYMQHPLFLNIAFARHASRNERTKNVYRVWKKLQEKGPDDREVQKMIDATGPTTNKLTGGLVITHGGSTAGNLDAVLPLDYPLAPDHPLSSVSQGLLQSQASPLPRMPVTTPTPEGPGLHVHSMEVILRCRPTELYLTTNTFQQQLTLGVVWDENVYDQRVIREWLDEITDAALWYLDRKENLPDMASYRAKL